MKDCNISKEKACEQFVRRCRYSSEITKIDNAGLHAGSPMYYYCKDCGIPTEVLPEDHLFPPVKQCSQCLALSENNWMKEALRCAEEEI
jgi:hypothetical protein